MLLWNGWELIKDWIIAADWPYLFGYAEWSKAFKLLDAESHGVMVSKDVVFDKIAKWSPSLDISGRTGSTDNSTYQFEESFESDTSVLEDEEEMTTGTLD